MPQLQLPLFPHGATEISKHLATIREGETITYLYGHLPIFTHHKDDVKTFRMITSQIYVNGCATQSEICRAFGITPISIKRSVKLYRSEGTAGFYKERNGVDPEFKASMDVPKAGVLCALPALLESGLLSSTDKHFQLPKGYYRLDSIFLLLSFLALARIKTIEDLRYSSPGEWGKILGIDRIPEAKTLREKIGILSENEKPPNGQQV